LLIYIDNFGATMKGSGESDGGRLENLLPQSR